MRIKIISTICILMVCLSASARAAERPNVVFILVDDSEANEYGCYDGRTLTPHIDSLAESGVRFDYAFTSSSVCTPTRYTCMSGQYASRAESLRTRYGQPEEMPTFVRWNTYLKPGGHNVASVLQDNGYTTAMIGKWHMGHTLDYHEKVSKLPGAELSTENKSVMAGDPAADRSMSGGQPYALDDPNVNRFLRQRYECAVDDIRRNFGFDYVASFYSGNLTDYSKEMVNFFHHNQDWVTQGALEFLDEQADADKPFFMVFSSTLQHGPTPLDSVRGNRRITAKGLIEEAPNVQPDADSIYRRLEDAGLSEWKAPFVWLDDSVGAVMDKLREHGMDRNTVVFFFSDQQSWGKGSCFDGGVKTPLLVSWPEGLSSGQVNTDLIGNIDFAPTIFDMCSVEAPADMHLDGMSFLPLLQGEEREWREALFFELGHMRAARTRDFKYIAIREYSDEEWATLSPQSQEAEEYRRRFFKLSKEWLGYPDYRLNEDVIVRWRRDHAKYASDSDQLYDLRIDPSETMNVYENLEYGTERKEMEALLEEWLLAMPGPFAEFKQ